MEFRAGKPRQKKRDKKYRKTPMVKEIAIRKVGIISLLGLAGLLDFIGLRPIDKVAATTDDAHGIVDLPKLGRQRIAVSLNLLGDTCLRANLLTKKVLAVSRGGDVIEIVSDNLSSVETIPFMSPNYNCVHLVTLHEEQCWKLYLRKEEDEPLPAVPATIPGSRGKIKGRR